MAILDTWPSPRDVGKSKHQEADRQQHHDDRRDRPLIVVQKEVTKLG